MQPRCPRPSSSKMSRETRGMRYMSFWRADDCCFFQISAPGQPEPGPHGAPWVPEANGPETLQPPWPAAPRGFPPQTLRANTVQISATDTQDLPSPSKSVPQVGNVALVLLHRCTRKRAGTSLWVSSAPTAPARATGRILSLAGAA